MRGGLQERLQEASQAVVGPAFLRERPLGLGDREAVVTVQVIGQLPGTEQLLAAVDNPGTLQHGQRRCGCTNIDQRQHTRQTLACLLRIKQ
ncbi:hypothetical protein D3C81_1675350 [compost metagenome]